VRSFYLCLFYWKARPSRASWESSGLENISKVAGYQLKVGQNHAAREAVSATLPPLKWDRAIFWPRNSKPSVRSFYLCSFYRKPRLSGVSLESLRLENFLHVRGNQGGVGQNRISHEAVMATFSVLKWSGAVFRPRSSKPSVWIFFLCPFYWKPSPSRDSSESLGLENNPQVPGNRPKVGQNHTARKSISSTFSVLKWSGAIFRSRSSKPNLQIFFLCPFH